MTILDSYIVLESDVGQYLYDVACKAFAKIIPSRKGIKKAIKRKSILVDGEIGHSGWKLRLGQKIDLLDQYSISPKIYELSIEVLYEDDHIAIVNKPHGLITSGNQFRNLYNTLGYNLKKSKAIDALPYPTTAHRLDTETSGCVIITKSKTAQIQMNQLFEAKKVEKTYIAIVHGKTPRRGIINLPIKGQAASTKFETIEYKKSKIGEVYSKIKMYPLTGRTHQLRIHCACLGHPILGDKIHGTKGNILLHKGLFLCSLAVCFHLDSRKIGALTKVPNKFDRFFKLITM